MRKATKRNCVVQLARDRGALRAADVRPLGISANYLYNLAREGTLAQVGRGLFVLPDYPFTEHHSFVEVTVRIPDAVICLLSALRFHDIGTQLPNAVWIALPHSSHFPKSTPVPLQLVRMSSSTLHIGVENHRIEGVDVKVFSAAKTVADCFKFRSLVGTDVCVEALTEALHLGKVTPSELYHFARVDRVWEILRPYLEAIQCQAI